MPETEDRSTARACKSGFTSNKQCPKLQPQESGSRATLARSFLQCSARYSHDGLLNMAPRPCSPPATAPSLTDDGATLPLPTVLRVPRCG